MNFHEVLRKENIVKEKKESEAKTNQMKKKTYPTSRATQLPLWSDLQFREQTGGGGGGKGEKWRG